MRRRARQQRKVNYKVIIAVVSIVAIVALLSVAALSMSNRDKTENSGVEAPKAPEITEPQLTTVKPDDNVVNKINESGEKVKDEWYKTRLEDVGIYADEQNLMDLRSEVCGKLDNGASLTNISVFLSDKGYNEEQQGVIIASSMLSQCQDATAKIKNTDISQTIKE